MLRCRRGGYLGSENRRASHHGRQLSRQLEVDAKTLLATALGLCVQTLGGLADDAEILRVLQRYFLRHGQGHGRFGKYSITELAAIRSQNHTGLGSQRGNIHVPAVRCGRK